MIRLILRVFVSSLIFGAALASTASAQPSWPRHATFNENGGFIKTAAVDYEKSCIRVRDIPKLFPLDAVSKTFRDDDKDVLGACDDRPASAQPLTPPEFALVGIRYLQGTPDPATETATSRTIPFSMHMRILDGRDGKPLPNSVFTIETSDGRSLNITTDENGELGFNDRITHDYYKPERFILKVARLRHYSGFTQRLVTVMNPWDKGGFGFARALGRVSRDSVRALNIELKSSTQIRIPSVSLTALSTEIVGGKVVKTFGVEIKAIVARKSSNSPSPSLELLRPGTFNLQYSVRLAGESKAMARKRVVVDKEGRIVETLHLVVNDPEIAQAKAEIELELTPATSGSGLMPAATFKGEFVPAAPHMKVDLRDVSSLN